MAMSCQSWARQAGDASRVARMRGPVALGGGIAAGAARGGEGDGGGEGEGEWGSGRFWGVVWVGVG